MFDDMYDDEEWGYGNDPVDDMWIDYTTDIYEDTDYSGEHPHEEHDSDMDAFAVGYIVGSTDFGSKPRNKQVHPIQIEEKEQKRLNLIVAAICIAAALALIWLLTAIAG